MNRPKYITPTHAAKHFGLSTITVWIFMRQKIIQSTIYHKKVVIDPSVLKAWLRRHPYAAAQLRMPTYNRDKSFKIQFKKWR